MSDETTPAETPRHSRGVRFLFFLGRHWVTTVLTLAVIGASIYSGAVASTFSHTSPLFQQVAYGLPALLEGRWWTWFTGMFFTMHLLAYIPILILLVIVVGVYEGRAGHLRTIIACVGGQIVGGILTALILWPFRDTTWEWASRLGKELDVGISIGIFATLGALSALMQPVWRRRVRVAAIVYLVSLAIATPALADVEHLVGFVLGLVAGPLLAGERPHFERVRFGRRSQRAIVALITAVLGLTGIIDAFSPSEGRPFISGLPVEQPAGVSLVVTVFCLLLIFAADGLRRGRRLAWVFVTIIAALGTLAGIITPPSTDKIVDLVQFGSLLVLLLVTVRAFRAKSRRRAFRRAGRRLLVLAAALFVYTAVGFVILQDEFTPKATPLTMLSEFGSRLVFQGSGLIAPNTGTATIFVTTIGAVWIIAILLTIVSLFYSIRRPQAEPDQDEHLRVLLRRYDSSNLEWMLTWKGITAWFSDDRETAVGFTLAGSVALALGDPVGPEGTKGEALKQFDRYCFDNGWIPCFFSASQETAELAQSMGWKAVEVAEDSVMPLEGLEFAGKSWNAVRTSINRAGREGVELVETRWDEAAPVVTDQLRIISGGWVSDKALPEMGFTLGTLREADDPEVRLNLAVDADKTVHGFTSWLPVGRGDKVVGWTLDLMRRRDGGFRPVMEYLIGSTAMSFKEQGYEFLSLSAAPLAKAPDQLSHNSDQKVLQRLLDFLGGLLEPFYGFQSLFNFKQKFNPVHRPMYLVYPDESALFEIGVAVARAYMPDAGFVDWVRIIWGMIVPARKKDDDPDD